MEGAMNMASQEEENVRATGAPTVAQRMLDAAICAYSVTPSGYFPKSFFEDPVGFVEAPYPWINGPSAIDAGFVGTTDDGWAVISLRGTLGSYSNFASFFAFIRDWLQDDETHFVPLHSSSGTYLGLVHHGFHKATMALWPYFLSLLREMPWSKLKGLRITGHSKGAGMSFLVAALANAEKSAMKDGGPSAIEVHAFAAPLAGGPDFANLYNGAKLDKTTIRYQRAHDIVPFLAPYLSFDLLHQIDLWKARFDFELDSAIEYLRATVTRGYHLVGGLRYYPDHEAGKAWPSPVNDPIGQTLAQAHILGAIQGGRKNEIADAHLATTSYWPSIFGRDLPKPTLDELAAQFEGKFAPPDPC